MEIADIKAQLTLSQVLSHYGLKPDKHLRLHCPFHADKTPSLQVYYKTHTCYCFSSNCTTHGKPLDVIDFVMYKEGCSKGEAINRCKEMIGGAVTVPCLTAPPKVAILERMFTYFKNAVHNSKPAQDYISSRGLDATLLEIGYNSGQFHHGQRKDDELITACERVGLLAAWGTNSREGGQAYKAFGRGCIAFALRNADHQVSGLYFRSTTNDQDQKHFYLKDRKGLYPGYPVTTTKQLILTEAVIDAAVLQQHGFITAAYSVLACYGTNGFTKEHQSAITTLSNLTEIIFAFDGDDAGKAAVTKYSGILKELLPGVQQSTIVLPDGEDVASVAAGHDVSVLEHLLSSRQPVLAEAKQPVPVTSTTLDSSDAQKLRYRTAIAVYIVQGGVSSAPDSMKLTLSVECIKTGSKRRNKIDLYEDKQVERLACELAVSLELDAKLLATELRGLTDALESYRDSLRQQEHKETTAAYPLTLAERTAATDFLKVPGLIEQLSDLLGKTGIIGEEQHRLFLLLIALSHKMPQPLHALIQGSSGSGKTRLLRQVSDCMPPEKVTRLTRVSDKVLYNYPEHYFVNRLLCLEDIDGLSEEAEFALRELQSNGELNSAMSIKLENGQITSGQKTVRGPIGSLACTTRGEIYEDNMSRVFLVAVDEGGEQTGRILAYQNRIASGFISPGEEQQAKRFIQNLVRALEPLPVVNPYAGRLQLPAQAHKIRRLNDLFLSFVKMVTLVHQYQRKKDGQGRLITEVSDLEVAVGIMFDSIVLKVDELDGSLRHFFEKLKAFIGEDRNREFTRFDVRDATKVGRTQQHHYLNKLVELGYLHQYGHINRGFRYRVVHWDDHTQLRQQLKAGLQDQLQVLAGGDPDASERQTERQDVAGARESA